MDYMQILDFWFEKTSPKQWWQKNLDFDAKIKEHFGSLHLAASVCELFGWRESVKGRLAEIIVLDQFSRNIYRDTSAAFAQDALALCLAQEAVRITLGSALTPHERAFLYMPFMHSESRKVHGVAEQLYAEPGLEDNYVFELKHKVIIDRFGRYPHRNAILNRVSTEEEKAFLAQPGSSF